MEPVHVDGCSARVEAPLAAVAAMFGHKHDDDTMPCPPGEPRRPGRLECQPSPAAHQRVLY